MHTITVTSAGNGSITAELKLSEEHVNAIGTLHGGFSATLVDTISSLGLLTHEKGCVPSVSVNMYLSYLNGANQGDTVEITGQTLKTGKTLAFLQAEIKNKKTGVLLVKASHTKFLLNN